jgi:putative tributyrin esterase
MALVSCHFFSHVLGLASTMTVLLPDLLPGPDGLPAPPARPFPVLYLLHGLSDDHTTWQRRTSLERFLEGLNLAVVMPAVQRSFYADSLPGSATGPSSARSCRPSPAPTFPLSNRNARKPTSPASPWAATAPSSWP